MFRLFGNKKLILLLACLIVFIALMGLTLGERKTLTWPEKFVKDTVSFAQSLFYRPAGIAAGFFENVGMLSNVYEENKALKKKLSDYAQDAIRLNILEEQVGWFEEALLFSERQKQANRYIWHFAEVISASPDPFDQTININIGEKDGIRENMAVATVDGLIGIVRNVAPFSSSVQLITAIDYRVDSTKAIAATTKENEESFGMIERYTTDGFLEMNKIDSMDSIKEDDTVLTSGYGEVFPKGIIIGTVVSRGVSDSGITHRAMIKPAANLNGAKLRQVFVIEVPEP
ncbi:MAG: rod shape-determining protein MreC [Paenibacillaceae bacterium]